MPYTHTTPYPHSRVTLYTMATSLHTKPQCQVESKRGMQLSKPRRGLPFQREAWQVSLILHGTWKWELRRKRWKKLCHILLPLPWQVESYQCLGDPPSTHPVRRWTSIIINMPYQECMALQYVQPMYTHVHSCQPSLFRRDSPDFWC